MSAINLIFEGPSRCVLSEHLAYELYSRAGVLTEKSGHYRLTVDGHQVGYYLMVEQPNLIRRPVLVRGSEVIFGFDKDAYSKL